MVAPRLGPMLREYIISEAMYALDIPTTRSLAVVTTGEPTYRETKLPGAILTRVASVPYTRRHISICRSSRFYRGSSITS